MERRVVQIRCAVWGGVSLGVGTLAYSLCSSSSIGCSTNLVVLTSGAVTARGCAAFSVIAHVGIGCMVLGAILLLGAFVLIARTLQRTPVVAVPARAEVPVVAVPAPAETPVATEPATVHHVPSVPPVADDAPIAPAPATVATPPARVEPRPPAPERVGPIPPGEDEPGGYLPVHLPPGWYGNPDNPDKPVQWWDGTRLVDRPPRTGR
jgi:hypothetical protein